LELLSTGEINLVGYSGVICPVCHVSVQTTGKYLGRKQRLQHAENDRFGIEPSV